MGAPSGRGKRVHDRRQHHTQCRCAIHITDQELQTQLDHEIKMAKMQSQSKPKLNGPAREEGSDKKGEVIALYERLTNVLVTWVGHTEFQLHKLPETRFKCLYTHVNDPMGEPSGNDPCTYRYTQRNVKLMRRAGISFDLLDTWARRDGLDISDGNVAKDELEQKTMYVPRDLDKQPGELREKLGFFNEEFLFSPTQSTVFMKSLWEALAPPAQPPPCPRNVDTSRRVE